MHLDFWITTILLNGLTAAEDHAATTTRHDLSTDIVATPDEAVSRALSFIGSLVSTFFFFHTFFQTFFRALLLAFLSTFLYSFYLAFLSTFF